MNYVLNKTCVDAAVALILRGHIEWGSMPPMGDEWRRAIVGPDDDLAEWSRCHLAVAGEGAGEDMDAFAMPICHREFGGDQLMVSLGGLLRVRHQAGLAGLPDIANAADYLLSLAGGQSAVFSTKSAAGLTFEADGDGWWVEVFRAGTWTSAEGMSRTYTTDELKDIVAAHKALADDLHIPLRLGDHAEDDDAGAKMAYGWVSDLKVKGDRLLAFFTHVPDELKEKMRSKQYRSVSIGLWLDWRYEGVTYPFVMNHVAILGALQPAVKGLADIDANMQNGHEVVAYTFTEGDEMELKEALAKISELEGKNAELTSAVSELDAIKAERDTLKQAVADHAEKAITDRVTAAVEQAFSEGRLAPAEKDAQVTMGLALAKTADFSEGGDLGAFAAWEQGLKTRAKVLPGESAHSGGGAPAGSTFEEQRRASAELSRKIHKDQ